MKKLLSLLLLTSSLSLAHFSGLQDAILDLDFQKAQDESIELTLTKDKKMALLDMVGEQIDDIKQKRLFFDLQTIFPSNTFLFCEHATLYFPVMALLASPFILSEASKEQENKYDFNTKVVGSGILVILAAGIGYAFDSVRKHMRNKLDVKYKAAQKIKQLIYQLPESA